MSPELGRRPVRLSVATFRQEVGEGAGYSWGEGQDMDSCSPEKRPPLIWAGVELSGRLPGGSYSLHVQTREQHMQRPKGEREILGLCGEIKSWGQAGLKRP